MTKTRQKSGYTTDLTLEWITQDLGPEWLQWQQYAAEWLATQNSGVSKRLTGIRHLVQYLKSKAPYAVDVATMFKGHRDGHQVSSEEFNDYLVNNGVKNDNPEYISFAVFLCDYILKHHLSVDDDDGNPVPMFRNPFEKIKHAISSTETVHSPLPYRYIQQLRHILCPYPTDDPCNKAP